MLWWRSEKRKRLFVCVIQKEMWTNHASITATTASIATAAVSSSSTLIWSLFTVLLLLATDKSINAFDLTAAIGGGNDSSANVYDNRPPYNDYAKIARYLVHKSNWTSMGTISTEPKLLNFPMVNVISMADSALNAASTGRIYFLLTDLDFTGRDLAVNNKLTALFTEDQDLSCTTNHTDTMEPICARVIFVGQMKKLQSNTDEFKFADQAYTDRHPASINWRHTHAFYFCKFEIEHIAVLDFYGGPHYVSIDDYYNANYDAEVASADADAGAGDVNITENEIYHMDDHQPSVITPKSVV